MLESVILSPDSNRIIIMSLLETYSELCRDDGFEQSQSQELRLYMTVRYWEQSSHLAGRNGIQSGRDAFGGWDEYGVRVKELRKRV